MKTFYNCIAVLAATFAPICANADVKAPTPSFYTDFTKMGEHAAPLPAEWSTYGNGEIPLQQWQDVFGDDGNGPYYRLMNINGTWGAFSNSSFREDIAADEWLISPSIHVENDDEVLLISIGGYGKVALNNYMVFISESGDKKEDFTDAPVAASTIYGYTSTLNQKQVSVRLSGYKDKDIHVAFVNRSKDCALLGVTEILVAPYHISVIDNTPQVLPEGETFNVSLMADVKLPYKTKGLTASLTTSTGVETTMEVDQTIMPSGSRLNVTFPETITIPAEGVEYTVTLLPHMEGAQPTVVTGKSSVPSTTYTPVVVVEELTGSWCGYCPRGAAFLDYYHDTYNDENGKVIGIAVHSGDRMEITGQHYISTVQNESGSSGFPSAFFQRTVKGDPSAENVVKALLDRPCYSSVRFDKVAFQPETDDYISIDFTVENAYDRTSLNQRIAFVVIENQLMGDDYNWNQANNLGGISQAAVEATYGAELWPYFEFYAQSPNTILYTEMVYKHVAREIYPDYYGALLEGSCEALKGTPFTMSFKRPYNVADWNNAALVALLIDDITGHILTADIIDAKDFNKDASAEMIVDEAVVIGVSNNAISISSPEQMVAEVYGIDGSLRHRGSYESGNTTIPADSFDGIFIVKVTTSHGTTVKKIAI